MRSISFGRISGDREVTGSQAPALKPDAAPSLSAVRAALRKRYGQLQAPGAAGAKTFGGRYVPFAPGARYAALARGGLRQASRLAPRTAEED